MLCLCSKRSDIKIKNLHLFQYLFCTRREPLFSAVTSFISLLFLRFWFVPIKSAEGTLCSTSKQNSPEFSSGLFNAPPSLTKLCPKFCLSPLFSLFLPLILAVFLSLSTSFSVWVLLPSGLTLKSQHLNYLIAYFSYLISWPVKTQGFLSSHKRW